MKGKEEVVLNNSRFDRDFAKILAETATELKKAGCGEIEVHLALLAMCGVPVQGVSPVSLHIHG